MVATLGTVLVFAEIVNGNRYFVYTTSVLWIERDITKDGAN